MKVIRAKDLPSIAAGHEDPSAPGVLKRVLISSSHALSGMVNMINWASLPAGRYFCPHHHHDMTEVFIIVTGSARMKVGSEWLQLERMDSVIVEPGEEHHMVNETSAVTEFVVIGLAPTARTK